ncbi:glutathione s-transferase omega 2 [Fusarium flagelliforme]|uniref:Glutathione s-transferase omega 2 n=1 Tax=Fusarium flagelliforme TaxID=2675880 RepID=A0A395MEP9_9HYPO|nr:glutathione s-transferase omega 2 [Fusarium flagelliforme]
MAPETFPQFPKLPKEIRMLIWEAAVRPVPGDRHVHRFFLADYHLKHPAPLQNIKAPFLNLLRVKNHAYDSLNHSSGLSLAIPKDDVDGNPNDSVYLSDSSLWTVCKESRQAMERRFNKNEWWSKEKAPFHPKRSAEPGRYLGQEGATHTASYKDYDGTIKHITMDHRKDLIYLDPRYLMDIDWFHYLKSDFISIFDDRIVTFTPQIPEPGFAGDDVALDYDRSISDTLMSKSRHYRQKNLEASLSNLIDMVWSLTTTSKRRVWFIDHALVPVRKAPGDESHGEAKEGESPQVAREIFRSDDCIYTEVKREDIGTLWQFSDYEKAYDGENHHAFDMLDMITGHINLWDFSMFRVLACESAPGRPVRQRKPWTRRCHGYPACEECYPKPVPRVRPSTIKKEGQESSEDVSESDLNLFD